MKPGVAAGAVAGAVGTLTLDVLSYGDMLLTGRAPSALPGQAAARLAGLVGIELGAEDSDAAANRGSALGALLGYGVGVLVGAIYGGVQGRRPAARRSGPILGGLAMLLADSPMVAQGLTDPRTWGARGWASDIVPHIGYGVATVATYRAITTR